MGESSSHKRDPRLERLAKKVPSWYLPAHLGVSIGLLGALTALFVMLLPPEPLRWPAYAAAMSTVTLGNFVEYALHRWPMHRRYKRFVGFFRNHTIVHHRYFTKNAMDMERPSDLFYVLPSVWVILASSLTLVSTTAFLYVVFGPQIGLAGGASLGAFALMSEILHVAFHLPEKWMTLPVLRSRWFQWVKRHHTIHHDPHVMRKWNFNIVIPLFDALLGTLAPPATHDELRRERAYSCASVSGT